MENEGSSPPVLRRKANKPTKPDASEVSMGKVLSLSFERAARDTMGLMFQVEECRYALQGISDLPTTLPDTAMWCLLDCAAGDIAAMSVDLQLLAGLIEFQTLGCVLKNKAPERAPTRVDGSLLMAVADDALARLSVELEGDPDHAWAQDYRYGAMIESKRALVLSLLAEQFHVFSLQVSLESGAKSGCIQIAFPVLPEVSEAPVEAEEETAEIEAFQSEIRRAPAVTEAVLARIAVPYSRLANLAVGDVLELPVDCLNNLTLEVSGQVVLAKATLGKVNGLRAAKIRLPASQEAKAPKPYDPVAERPGTPDEEILKETEAFLPDVEAVEDVAVLQTPEETEPVLPEEDIEDFSDLDDLDIAVPQVAAG
ncbi:FliM/FliN family flagellar motor C-terminal domain-containing protein [Shimia thalassica]|uniref:FliM/FliN family flagellar motor C-terminal domain-containing protein n=1 Tax=Shimia thalassica TaxID=1715693 RepID=UPI0026E2BA13|nr:FliM/FliN family flagellar motor C-terminal domain-containing protein [Shimia thalassica]MDO6483487.1 FliM/FliN family flagellar motor C-terminal domain-containing protein [Shimia thalassica]